MKHLHIYTSLGMPTGVLGYIFEQSPSFFSNNFCFDKMQYNRGGSVDPWDNHTDDDPHWTHTYIEYTEKRDSDFAFLDNFVRTFEARSVFGVSYGGYAKQSAWENNILQHVGTPLNEKMFDLWFECYMTRVFDYDDVVDSIRAHIHDHHQDNPEYREYVMNEYGNTAMELAREGTLEFWQLQTCYHHNHTRLPHITYKDTFRKYLRDEYMEKEHHFNTRNDTYMVDPLNINVYTICDDLKIQYSQGMQTAVDQWNSFKDKVLNGI